MGFGRRKGLNSGFKEFKTNILSTMRMARVRCSENKFQVANFNTELVVINGNSWYYHLTSSNNGRGTLTHSSNRGSHLYPTASSNNGRSQFL